MHIMFVSYGARQVWTRPGGIKASTSAGGFRCLGYVQVARPWSVVSGECEVDGQGCIQSPGYGQELYPNLQEQLEITMFHAFQECEFSVSAAYAMEVVDFQVESQDYDYLLVNGEKYSGNNMPHGTPGRPLNIFPSLLVSSSLHFVEARIVPQGSILWYTDDSVNHFGWKICPKL